MQIQLLEEFPQFGGGAAAHRERSVSAWSAHNRPHPTNLLLNDLNGVELLTRDVHRKATKLAESIANTLKQLLVVFYQVFCPKLASSLLVAQDGQYDIAR